MTAMSHSMVARSTSATKAGHRHTVSCARHRKRRSIRVASFPAAVPGAQEAVQHDIPKPVIVLVEPIVGENIGAAARAMKNFGLSELRLVKPKDGWPNPAADTLAVGAVDLLRSAKLYDRLEDALADMEFVYATTARPRGMGKQAVLSKDLSRDVPPGLRTAFVFGRENSGLTNQEVAMSNRIVTVDSSPDYPVLNLAQSVVLICHELYQWRKLQLAGLAASRSATSASEAATPASAGALSASAGTTSLSAGATPASAVATSASDATTSASIAATSTAAVATSASDAATSASTSSPTLHPSTPSKASQADAPSDASSNPSDPPLTSHAIPSMPSTRTLDSTVTSTLHDSMNHSPSVGSGAVGSGTAAPSAKQDSSGNTGSTSPDPESYSPGSARSLNGAPHTSNSSTSTTDDSSKPSSVVDRTAAYNNYDSQDCPTSTVPDAGGQTSAVPGAGVQTSTVPGAGSLLGEVGGWTRGDVVSTTGYGPVGTPPVVPMGGRFAQQLESQRLVQTVAAQSEARAGMDPSSVGIPPRKQVASHAEMEAFYNRLFQQLDAVDFFENSNRDRITHVIRNIYGRVPQLTKLELNVLQGIVSKLSKAREQKKSE